jgi:AcrR family transcriptional regulator
MKRALTPDAKEARRQKILNASLDEFFEKGFSAARMEDIARQSGVSKATLYLYFPSKEDIFNSLIDTFATHNIAKIETALASSPSARIALQRVLEFAPYIIQSSPLPKLLKILIGDACTFPEIVQTYRHKVIERGLGALEKLLTLGNQTGEFQVEDPTLTARLVIAPVLLSGIWHIIFERDQSKSDIFDVNALLKLHSQYLLKALTPDSSNEPAPSSLTKAGAK